MTGLGVIFLIGNIEGVRSQNVPIKIGVPQGSILGPLLYLVYVNDIEKSCGGVILSFADDTTLITSHANLHDLYKKCKPPH